jgi:hypothetical protein
MLNVVTAVLIAVLGLVYIAPIVVELAYLVLTDRTPLGRPDHADPDDPTSPGSRFFPGGVGKGNSGPDEALAGTETIW